MLLPGCAIFPLNDYFSSTPTLMWIALSDSIVSDYVAWGIGVKLGSILFHCLIWIENSREIFKIQFNKIACSSRSLLRLSDNNRNVIHCRANNISTQLITARST